VRWPSEREKEGESADNNKQASKQTNKQTCNNQTNKMFADFFGAQQGKIAK
jgi:hypothetical protein